MNKVVAAEIMSTSMATEHTAASTIKNMNSLQMRVLVQSSVDRPMSYKSFNEFANYLATEVM